MAKLIKYKGVIYREVVARNSFADGDDLPKEKEFASFVEFVNARDERKKELIPKIESELTNKMESAARRVSGTMSVTEFFRAINSICVTYKLQDDFFHHHTIEIKIADYAKKEEFIVPNSYKDATIKAGSQTEYDVPFSFYDNGEEIEPIFQCNFKFETANEFIYKDINKKGQIKVTTAKIRGGRDAGWDLKKCLDMTMY